MKKLPIRTGLILFFALIPAGLFSSQTDTLRYYKARNGYAYYRQHDIAEQSARFDIPGPALIRSVSVMLSSEKSDAEALLHIYGHEGGSSVPVVRADITAPIRIRKQHAGPERITVAMPGEGIRVDNNQFFLSISDMSEGTVLLTDQDKNMPLCSSAVGGEFYRQGIRHADGRWEYGEYAFVIEPVLEYVDQEPAGFYRDSLAFNTAEAALSKYTGISCGDLDSDGFLDLVSDGRLFMNAGGKRLGEQKLPSSLSGKAVLNILVDIDNDGDLDIVLAGEGLDKASLLVNQGSRKFTETLIGFPVLENPSGFSIGDLNSDNLPDIFIGQCTRDKSRPLANHLLFNSGKSGFSDKSDLVGESGFSTCRSASFVDFNNDNILDLYIGNYFGRPDELWQGQKDGGYRNVAAEVGLATYAYNYSSGGQWADFNNDGDMDFLAPKYLRPQDKARNLSRGTAILQNDGKNRTFGVGYLASSKIDYEERHSGGCWGDVNNDGYLDLFLTTSCDCRYADIYLQDRQHGFELQTSSYGLEGLSANRDALWADLDNDGRLELLMVNRDTLAVFRQNSRNNNNFVQLELLPHNSANRMAVGAKVLIYTGNQVQKREIGSGRGMMIQDPLRVHCGTGSESADSVVVVWPGRDGRAEVYHNIKANKLNRLGENAGKPALLGRPDVSIRAYPNPFVKDVNIYYQVKSESRVRISIFDLAGSLVKLLTNTGHTPGEYNVRWDARDERGERTVSGIYIYRVEIDGSEYAGKIQLTD